LRLRTRVDLALATTAVAVPAVLAVAVWSGVTSFLLSYRQESALMRAESNVRVVERALATTSPSVAEALTALPHAADAPILVLHRGGWYGTSLDADPAVLPRQLKGLVASGTAASQRVRIGGSPVLVIGLPTTTGAYFHVFPLDELDETYRTLSTALAALTVAAAALGALLGRAAGRRALKPLRPVIGAARAIAAGDLSARLDAGNDPDLDELATSFNRTAERLQAKVAQDERFAGDVSHEMRTTLMAMLNAFELVDANANLPDDVREPFELLGAQLRRFSVLVEELIEISRAGEDGVGLVLEQVIIGDLVTMAADRTAGRPVTHVSPKVERLRMRVDKRRIERVVVNLVHNAEVHGHGVVQVAVEPCDDGIRIFVDDAGPGVPVDRREHVFTRFASDGTGGVGLGLAIVARHVREHGGSVWVGDRPGGGSRFVVELPVQAP
jgi:signal transduction histidine kinase